MVQAFEILIVFASRCFCVPQKQKGVADAVIEAEKSTKEGTFGQDDPCNNRLPGASRAANKRISLS